MSQIGAFLFSPTGFLTTVFTVVGSYFVARLTRAGSKEANRTADWDKYSTGLASRLDRERERTSKLEEEMEEVRTRVAALELSRYRWKWWAQLVVSLLKDTGIQLPPTPETLENTDPRMRPLPNGNEPRPKELPDST